MVTLGTVRRATGTAAITEFLEHLFEGSGLRLAEVRRRSVRLEPPDAYWAVYRVRLEAAGEGAQGEAGGPGGERPASRGATRELRLVARAVFDSDRWREYQAKLLTQFGGAACDPLGGLGSPVLFGETQHAVWFYPVDLNLVGLARCADEAAMLRLLRQPVREVLDQPARITKVGVSLQRWLPEISAVLRYDLGADPAPAGRTIYAKVQHSGRDALTARNLEQLWSVAEASDGLLRTPRPLGHHAELGMVLQSGVPGAPVSGDRTTPVFMAAAEAAGRALALMHDSDLEPEDEQPAEDEMERLRTVLGQFVLVHPPAHVMLRDLLPRIQDRLTRTAERSGCRPTAT